MMLCRLSGFVSLPGASALLALIPLAASQRQPPDSPALRAPAFGYIAAEADLASLRRSK